MIGMPVSTAPAAAGCLLLGHKQANLIRLLSIGKSGHLIG